MRELETEYAGQFHFNVLSAEETKKRQDEVIGFGFEAQRHGLVILDPKGEALAKLPGHQFGRAEIESAMKNILAGKG